MRPPCREAPAPHDGALQQLCLWRGPQTPTQNALHLVASHLACSALGLVTGKRSAPCVTGGESRSPEPPPEPSKGLSTPCFTTCSQKPKVSISSRQYQNRTRVHQEKNNHREQNSRKCTVRPQLREQPLGPQSAPPGCPPQTAARFLWA